MDKIRIGVLGLGDICHVYLTTLKKYDALVTLEGCAARSLEKAQLKAEQYGIHRAFATPEEMIADPDIDLILNLTTPEVHAKYNYMALEHGKHVYTEKPLAGTYSEALDIMNLAAEKGLKVGCAPDTFLGGRFQTVRELLDKGVIGEITGATAFCSGYHGGETFHPNPNFLYQPGAGPLMDIGPYYVTALLSLLGPVHRCCSMSKRTFDKRTITSQPHAGEEITVNVDTLSACLMEFDNGAIVNLFVSYDVWDSELPRVELYGTKGTICIPDVDPLMGPNVFGGEILLKTEKDYRWVSMPRDEEETKREWTSIPLKRPFCSVSFTDNHRGIGLIDLVKSMDEDREPRASGSMALHSIDVMEGMLESSKTEKFFYPRTTFAQPALLPEDYL